MSETLLRIDGLKTHFFTEAGVVKAVDGVSFNVLKGESLGLVGESGSGKSVSALSVLRIVPKPGRIIAGKIEFKGENLLSKHEKQMHAIRGKDIAMIFQDPSSSLNPLYRVETQLRDVLMAHEKLSEGDCRKQIVELLSLVGIPDPEIRMRDYPHQFSGGMKQRVAIARALALQPTLLFADEPTTALDVTIQAQVLELLEDLKKRMGMSLVMITHDMGIIAKMTTRVVVMYAGNIYEIAKTQDLYEHPMHPYTALLLSAVPRLDMRKTLNVIPGNIPNLIEPPLGCRFHPRCKYATSRCKEAAPPLEQVAADHYVACWQTSFIMPKGENRK
jgi:oligopeptide/dipeptide ABC transporter ATP-binding protein